MSKKKIDRVSAYNEKYGNIPISFKERIINLGDKLKNKDFGLVLDYIRNLRMMEWKEINIVIYLEPKATPRARLCGRTKTFYVSDAAANSKMFKDFLKGIKNELRDIDYDVDQIITPTEFNVSGFISTPSSMSNLEKFLAELQLLQPVSTPDFDNMAKTYADMIQGHILINDSLIFKSVIRKVYSSKPRVEFNLRYMTKHDCKYNKKKIESWKHYKDYLGEDLDAIVK